ncbi:MAG: DUF58 domain-containing protein [Spirochaetales bacterium]|jgi:hypothetical protein|nr:DUF58 domain-containing protein [Spirochaetales bacterium]
MKIVSAKNTGRGFLSGCFKCFGFFKFFKCFKAGGLFVFLAALGIGIRGLAYRDPYGIVLAGIALVVWLALFFAGFFGSRRLASLTPGWLAPLPLVAGGGGTAHVITGLEAGVPYFFRLHFVVRGNFSPGLGSRFFVSAEAGGGGSETSLSLNFPMSGIFHGRGGCRLRDVFGFFSFPCGPVLHRSLPVQPAPWHKKAVLRVDPFSGAEDKQSRSQTDEERYYMREYSPGDRFRDINWKSSERLATLITRISPHTREKTKLVYLAFRNYGQGKGLFSFWLLDRTKARLALFLRTLKAEHPEFIFHISAAGGQWMVESEEEIESFLDELAGMGFQPPDAGLGAGADSEADSAGGSGGTAGSELYVFSTSCDAALASVLASRGERISHLFVTVPAERGSRDTAVFRLGSVFTEGFFPVSGFFPCGCAPWRGPLRGGALRVDRLRRAAAGGFPVPVPAKGSLEITYAEVRL